MSCTNPEKEEQETKLSLKLKLIVHVNFDWFLVNLYKLYIDFIVIMLFVWLFDSLIAMCM